MSLERERERERKKEKERERERPAAVRYANHMQLFSISPRGTALSGSLAHTKKTEMP